MKTELKFETATVTLDGDKLTVEGDDDDLVEMLFTVFDLGKRHGERIASDDSMAWSDGYSEGYKDAQEDGV